MTTNVTLVTSAFAICVADRRLSKPTGGVVSERATKITNFECSDAVGIITFNGIGRDLKNETPNDWIAADTDMMQLNLDGVVERIKDIATKKLAALPPGIDKRHTFVIAGFQRLQPFAIMISNYESLTKFENLAKASDELTVQRRNDGFIFIVTGVTPHRPRKVLDSILNQVKKGAAAKILRSSFVKIIRDIAYRGKLKGSVGTNLQSSILSPLGGFENNGHVPGGSSVVEAQNYLTPGASYAEIMIDSSPGPDGPAWGLGRGNKKASIPEPPCKICGNPVPMGQKRCGACNELVS